MSRHQAELFSITLDKAHKAKQPKKDKYYKYPKIIIINLRYLQYLKSIATGNPKHIKKQRHSQKNWNPQPFKTPKYRERNKA